MILRIFIITLWYLTCTTQPMETGYNNFYHTTTLISNEHRQYCRNLFNNITKLDKNDLDQGRTDHINLNNNLDPDLESHASYGHDLLTCKSSRSTVSWKKWTDGGNCITCRINVMDKGASYATYLHAIAVKKI